MPDRETKQTTSRRRLSRRRFLQGSGVAAAVAAVTAGGVACNASASESGGDQGVATWQKSAEEFYDRNSPPPPEQPTGEVLHFFTPGEAKTVDALVSRILPGDASDPGAHEAGVVVYIDYRLSVNEGFDVPTYFHPPFAHTYDSDSPPPEAANDKSVVWVQKDELERYGFQSMLTPRETYRAGLVALDAYCQARFGKGFTDLGESEQDQVVDALASAGKKKQPTKGSPTEPQKSGNAPQSSAPSDNSDVEQFFKQPTAKSFFKEVHTDVINGMFSDPAYGGNKDKVGWTLIGYAGAQRGYTPEDLLAEQVRPPQSLAELHAFHPGQEANKDVILPVSSDETHHQPAHQH